MVRPQSYDMRAGLPEQSSRAWIEALRADIKHIYELRWQLTHRVATNGPAEHQTGRERGPAITRIRSDTYRQLDELEQDVYERLDPYLAKSEQDLAGHELSENRNTRITHRLGNATVKELKDLKRLRQAKLRAIDLARHAVTDKTEGKRARSRIWTRVTDVVMRSMFFLGFWVFFAGLWIWAHVVRRDTYRH